MSFIGRLFIIISFFASLIVLAYVPDQSDFLIIITCFAVAFACYTYLIKNHLELRMLLIIAVSIRLLLLPAFPNLSDDIYRFVWDGIVMNHGMNPYVYLPSDLIQSSNFNTEQLQTIFNNLNSPDYYTIYPPISQIIFYISTLLGTYEILASTYIMKIFLCAGEFLTLWVMLKLLRHFNINTNQLAWYALNPLVLIEVNVNMHFEGLMVGLFLLGWYLLINSKTILSGILIALSIATKLLPLMLLPFFISYLGLKKALYLFTVIGIILLALFTPILINLSFFWNSLDLYFQKFEFNASIYYFLRWIGFQIKGYNMIHAFGPALAGIAFLSIMYIWYRYHRTKTKDSITMYWLLAFTIYLLTATTVHPWYLIFPIALCVFTNFSYPLIWSFLICLTYVNYSYSPYNENLWFVLFEYLVVFGLIALQLGDRILRIKKPMI